MRHAISDELNFSWPVFSAGKAVCDGGWMPVSLTWIEGCESRFPKSSLQTMSPSARFNAHLTFACWLSCSNLGRGGFFRFWPIKVILNSSVRNRSRMFSMVFVGQS